MPASRLANEAVVAADCLIQQSSWSLGHALLGARPAGSMSCPRGAQGRTQPTPSTYPTNANDAASVTTRYRPCAAKAQQEKEHSRVEGHRDGPCATGDGTTLWPYGPPGRRSCGLPVRCRTVGEHGASWVIRHVPVNRACVPKSMPRLAKNCTRRTDEPAEIPSNRARQPGWLAGESSRSPPANRRRLPADETGKQADAPGRWVSDPGRSRSWM